MKQLFTYLVLLSFTSVTISASAQRATRMQIGTGQAQASTSNISPMWVAATEAETPSKSLLRFPPAEYLVYKLDVAALKSQLFGLSTNPDNGIVVKLPMPDGTFRAFKVWQTPMMPDALAAQYPDIKTFTAEAVNDRWVTAKLDFTEFGFHAAFFDGENTSLIDPYDNLNDGFYVVHYKQNENRPFSAHMRCEVSGSNELSPGGEILETIHSGLPATDLAKLTIPAPTTYKSSSYDKGLLGSGTHEMDALTTNGTLYRQYRLALSANHFYCQAATALASPTIGQCFSAMTTTMNRVNGVYNREIAVQLNFCTNENLMIWPTLTGSSNGTDPFGTTAINTDAPTCLSINQTQCDTRIGSGNYDIGHIFTTGAGGLASLGIICNNSFKAQGVTGSSVPVGDAYDIDYVCHEMGHQFGSSHTFNNNIDGACATNASATHAYEPGSGATIMDYAGICSPDNVQTNSSAYFSANSLEQIQAHMAGSGGTCASTSASGHPIPTMSGFIASYNIPYKTPFELSSPTATVGAMDTAVTYGWFQWNLGDFGARLNQTFFRGPIFRSYQPVYDTNRVFPRINTVLAGLLSNTGEKAPDTTRYLTFKTVVRNIFAGKGCFTIPTDTIHINAITTGPLNGYGGFRVTSQNTGGIVYTGGSTQTITWNVVGTNTLPVSCTNVTIYMSTDGGFTWPYVVGTFPNSGTASVTVPNPGSSSTTARFKVKGAGNVFFNVNGQNFTVNPGVVTAPITGTFTVCTGATTTLSDVTPGGTWSSSAPAIATVGLATGIVTGVSGGTATITYTAPSGFVTAVVTVQTAPAAPAAITGSATVCVGLTTTLSDASPGGTWASSDITRATVSAAGVVTGVAAGTANITYTITNACGSTNTTRTMTVSAPTAVAPITGTTALCEGNTTTLACATAGGVWTSTNTAVGTISAGGIVTGIAAGTTTISYSITAGCVSAATTVVTVNSLPAATTTPSGAIVICTGGSINITASPITAGFTYQWQDGGINIPGATSSAYTATTGGNFRVVITNTSGCTGTSAAVTVTVSGAAVVVPSVSVAAAPGTNICASVGAVSYTATPVNGGGAPVYQWYVNGTATGGPGATFSYTPANGDIVKCELTSSLPCAVPAIVADSVTMTVTPTTTPAVSISPAPNDTVCTGNSATYTAVPVSGGSAPSYQWTVNSVIVATGPTFTNVPSNGDVVFCQMTSTASCITTPVATSAPLVMTVQDPAVNSVTISASSASIVAGESVTFVALALNTGSSPAYQWLINSVVVPGATNVTFTTNTLTNGQVVHCKLTSSLPCVLPHTALSGGFMMTVTSGIWETGNNGNAFMINPNPNHGTFTVMGRGALLLDNDVTITVSNVLGQAIYSSTVHATNGGINELVTLPAGVSAGVYFATITSGTERAVFRVVID